MASKEKRKKEEDRRPKEYKCPYSYQEDISKVEGKVPQ
jgi:hypothetical protein